MQGGGADFDLSCSDFQREEIVSPNLARQSRHFEKEKSFVHEEHGKTRGFP